MTSMTTLTLSDSTLITIAQLTINRASVTFEECLQNLIRGFNNYGEILDE